jgi:hypothetical protein
MMTGGIGALYFLVFYLSVSENPIFVQPSVEKSPCLSFYKRWDSKVFLSERGIFPDSLLAKGPGLSF